MRPHPIVLAAALLLASVCPAEVLAADTSGPAPALTGAPTQASLADPEARRALEALPLPAPLARPRAATPLLADLYAVLDRQDEQLVALRAELTRAGDGLAALAVQRRIERLRQDTEVELLRVQATHARRAGNTALAARLDAAVAELTAPQAPREPRERPAPARDDAR